MQERLDRLFHRLALRRIARRSAGIGKRGPKALERTIGRARQLRRAADGLIRRAEAEIRGSAGVAPLPDLPARTEWASRSQLWSEGGNAACPLPSGFQLGTGVSVYHDGEPDRACLRTIASPGGPARYGVVMETTDFSGEYLSVSLALPEAVKYQMTAQSLIRTAFVMTCERPIRTFARLKLRHGPNTEEQVRTLDQQSGRMAAEFDLFYMDILPDTVTDLWVDVIFEAPRLARIEIADVVFMRRRRAGL